MAKQIWDDFPKTLQNSVFGWKFGANVAYLSGQISKAVPLTRKLFDSNPTSLDSLQWYVHSLLRVNDTGRVRRVVEKINDETLKGSVHEKCDYVSLLVFCSEVERARSYAYRLYCENQSNHLAWLALSSSILNLGALPSETKDLWLETVEENAAVEVGLPTGEKRKYIIECDDSILPLRQENLHRDHPIAQAMWGLKVGDTFKWPIRSANGDAFVISVKHKALDAFHFVMQRFEEQFPEADGFSSIRCDPAREDGLDELMSILRERAEYGKKKISEYREGSIPLAILGANLGLDPVDTFLGVFREGGAKVKVSTCGSEDQKLAAAWLKSARKHGIICDAISIYLLRRFDLADVVVDAFGKIGITQRTIDIFARRLHVSETMGGYEVDGRRRASSMAYHDGRILLTELSEEEILEKIRLHQSDLDWLHSSVELIPAVAKEDPSDEIIKLRNAPGGEFLDDLLACDGSGRILVSDDLLLRQWGQTLFGIRGVWIQALLFYLQQQQKISSEKFVSTTIQLLAAGEEALSITSEGVITAAKMMLIGEMTEQDFELLCGVIGQSGASMRSHVGVAVEIIENLWALGSLSTIRHTATSSILRNLVRHQREGRFAVIDRVIARTRHPDAVRYIATWRIGHFT